MTDVAIYRDAGASIDDRLRDLLARMTRAEKIAQLGSIWAFEIVAAAGLQADRLPALMGHGLGEISRLAGSTHLSASDVAAIGNEIQRYLVEGTRLGIPAIFHEESLHGLLASDAPSFQQSIGAAATFDPDLVAEVAGTIRRRMLATGARHALAPVLDIARDPRWGRIEETYGEDPYLAAVMGCAYVGALQGPELATGVVATGKHMVGHALAEGGMNQAPAHVGPRELRDEQLLPFEAAIREAGLASVMPAYGEVDGVPCHASRELFPGIVRGEWGFDGIVSSDYSGIEFIARQHRVTGDLAHAAASALAAGVDLELPRFAAYAEPLERALDEGLVPEALLDAAVARVLRTKIRLGLFDHPYVEPPSSGLLASLEKDEARVGSELARRSMVLVENDGTLPLDASVGRIAVIGPHATSPRDLLGDYSHAAHIEALLELRQAGEAVGVDIPNVALGGRPAGTRTILDALRQRFADAEIRHARGTGIREGSDEGIAEAVAAAGASDVAVVVLGERSGLTANATTGEARDRRDLGFFGRQQELLQAVVATGTPVVLIVVSGRPLAIEWAAEHCAAVLLTWVPGDSGPDAIASALAGDVDPGGRLPVTVPRHVGQVPLTYRHHPSGGRSNWKGDYADGSAAPLWPFGFGRSYTRFALSDLRVSAATVPTRSGEVTVSFGVANVGDRAGDEVVQLYARDEEAQVARPILELCGFRRIHLAPGEARRVSFVLHAEQFAYTAVEYRRIIEPGNVTLSAGTSSADLPLRATIELVGPVVDLPDRSRFVTRTTVH